MSPTQEKRLPSDYDLVVLGAGAAGMMAASRAAARGRSVLVLEKSTKAGVKILMSGGTRCNLTHDATADEIADSFEELSGKQQSRFLRHALHHLPPDALVALFEAAGLATKVERTGKVFPQSDRALDVQQTLIGMVIETGAELALGEPAKDVDLSDGRFVVATSKRHVVAEKLLIAVGGQSYPGCGTVGDGYAWAKRFGHRIVAPRPALAPLKADAPWAAELQGTTVPDARLSIASGAAKPDLVRRGSLLLTHFGLSGPVAMDASRAVMLNPTAGDWRARCDFLPSTKEESLDQHLRDADGGKTLIGLLAERLTRRLASALLENANTPHDRRLAEMSRAERNRVIASIKRTEVPLLGSLGFKKAEVTAGGVDLSEVNPRTMESRLQPGLYFAGEVLDVDGPIGGYNFQAAFSTGALAGDTL